MTDCDAIYGEFEYNTGIVYGGSLCYSVLPKVEILARDLIRVRTNQDLVVNDAFLDESNYSIVNQADPSKTLRVRKVQEIKDDTLATPEVLLHIDRPDPGVTYVVSIGFDVISRTGTHPHPGEDSGTFSIRPLKMDAARAIIPKHFELRPGSNIRGMLQAIMNQDDIIGGSESERIIGS